MLGSRLGFVDIAKGMSRRSQVPHETSTLVLAGVARGVPEPNGGGVILRDDRIDPDRAAIAQMPLALAHETRG